MKWINFVVPSKFAKNTEGHLNADTLRDQHPDSEAYYCAFDIDADALKLDEGEPTFKGYEGIARPAFGLVQFDFDSEDIHTSYKEMQSFVSWLGVNVFVCFSGSKGFHVGVPFGHFNLEVDAKLPRKLKALAGELKKHFPTLDDSVYNVNRKFRVLNSKHPKTGLYKSRIDPKWNLEYIAQFCEKWHGGVSCEPLPEGIPLPQLTEIIERLKAYDYEPQEVGTRKELSAIEKYENKRCIKKLLKSDIAVGERNPAAFIIINDFFKIGKTIEECSKVMLPWGAKNLPHDRQHEIDTIINDIYSGVRFYNHGCQEPLKERNCSAKCAIWAKVDPDKRPRPADMSDAKHDQLLKEKENKQTSKELEITYKLLTELFQCKCENNVYSDGNLIKQDHDLFYYKEGMWHHCENGELDYIKTRIALCFGAKVRSHQTDSAFKTFVLFTPSKPKGVNLFSPNPDCTNFNNGTLHLLEDESGNYSLDFKQHSKEDYLTFKIGYDYPEGKQETNTEFENLLLRIFKDDPDKTEKIACLGEMFGSALIPAFPHLFFLFGVPNSGKTVICKILMNLIGRTNISRVQPHEFNGFNMNSMVNKLVNIVTDINTKVTIEDSIVKQIEDREPIRVQRKNKLDIDALLPAIHIFGANSLPRTFDGTNKAHDRRWTILKFNHAHQGDMHRNIDKIIFHKNPDGILAFAIDGLKRLVENRGFFSDSESGKHEKNEWQLENDIVGLFLKDIEEGEVTNPNMRKIIFNKKEKIFRNELWLSFDQWKNDSGRKNSKLNRHKFCALIRNKGISEIRLAEGRYFLGITAL